MMSSDFCILRGFFAAAISGDAAAGVCFFALRFSFLQAISLIADNSCGMVYCMTDNVIHRKINNL